MDKLQACAKAFQQLLDIEYRIFIGRKQQQTKLTISFTDWDFHHLMGLGKLKDLRISTQRRNQVFSDILSGDISYASLSRSQYIQLIENRFVPLTYIESLLDSNRLVFRYNRSNNNFSAINAEYLLSTPFHSTEIYIFLDKKPHEDSFFCRSFFPKEHKDYTERQAKYTLLYKEKITKSTGSKQVQYIHPGFTLPPSEV